jgi:transposase-like protein
MVQSGRKRQRRSKQERRRIVEETLKSGASVSQVARVHDINANQVFAWRKLYREGHLEIPQGSSALVPVKVTEAVERLRATSQGKTKPPRTGIIDMKASQTCIGNSRP